MSISCRFGRFLTLGLGLAALVSAQSNFAVLGVSYQPSASPAVAGTGIYAKLVSGNTWAFTCIDALPATVEPFTVTTQIGAGVAQKLVTLGKVEVFVPVAAGFSWTGSNVGWAWNSGVLAVVPLKGEWSLAPNLRFLKSSVSGGSGYQVIAGVGVGWRW